MRQCDYTQLYSGLPNLQKISSVLVLSTTNRASIILHILSVHFRTLYLICFRL